MEVVDGSCFQKIVDLDTSVERSAGEIVTARMKRNLTEGVNADNSLRVGRLYSMVLPEIQSPRGRSRVAEASAS